MPDSTHSKSSIHLTPGFTLCGALDPILGNLMSPHQNNPQKTDAAWMGEALTLATQGVGSSNPNPSVGCILVDQNGIEISRGHTQPYPGKHAEKIAFEKLKTPDLMKNGTAYLTLEPCSHFGNNPPCVDLLIQSPLARIVIARVDPNPQVNGAGIQQLKDAGKQVEIGLLENETTASYLPFFIHKTLKRPAIALKWAQTLDGQLADDTSVSQWISGPTSRKYTHWLRQRYDAILVGVNTLLHDQPELSIRTIQPALKKNPLPIIFDPKGSLYALSKEKQDALRNTSFKAERTWIYITTQEILSRYHASSWLTQQKNIFPISIAGVHLVEECMQALQSRQIEALLGRPLQSVLIEGGAKTLTLWLESGYTDLIHTVVAPLLSGGKLHRISSQRLLKQAHRFSSVVSFRLDSDTVIELVSQDVAQRFFRHD